MGHRVLCVDNDEARVKTLREGGVPIYEEHLPELLARHRGRGVEFTDDLCEAVQRSEAIFIAVGTPQGDTGAADLSYVEAVVSEIARCIDGYKVIVEKSTVPVYTNEWIRRVLHRNGVDPISFDVVSNPEFLREGTAVGDFLHPDRIVVGAGTERSANLLRRIYEPLTGGSYYAQPGALPGPCSAQRPAKLLVTSAQSAEIIKHASNSFLALKISFINAVANLAEAVDADIEDIAAGIGMDSRFPLGCATARRGFPTAR
jgi:UDPglucose 6-dehydrogenase